jgi:hypothetical protein
VGFVSSPFHGPPGLEWPELVTTMVPELDKSPDLLQGRHFRALTQLVFFLAQSAKAFWDAIICVSDGIICVSVTHLCWEMC